MAKSIAALEEHLNDGWKHEDFTQEMVLMKEEPQIKAADLESIQDELGTFSKMCIRERCGCTPSGSAMSRCTTGVSTSGQI